MKDIWWDSSWWSPLRLIRQTLGGGHLAEERALVRWTAEQEILVVIHAYSTGTQN